MTDIDLKPCPFCGASAVIMSRPMTRYGESQEYVAVCTQGTRYCPASAMHAWAARREWAITAWNTRPSDASAIAPSTSAQVEGGGVTEHSLSRDPGRHPCGERDEASLGATAALAPGWVAVPIKPTETMCSAGDRAQYDTDEDHELSPLVYAAMIAAAPQSPLTGEGGE